MNDLDGAPLPVVPTSRPQLVSQDTRSGPHRFAITQVDPTQ